MAESSKPFFETSAGIKTAGYFTSIGTAISIVGILVPKEHQDTALKKGLEGGMAGYKWLSGKPKY